MTRIIAVFDIILILLLAGVIMLLGFHAVKFKVADYFEVMKNNTASARRNAPEILLEKGIYA